VTQDPKKPDELPGRPRDLLRLLERARPHAGWLAASLVALLGSGGLTLVFPAITGRVVDAALSQRDLAQLDAITWSLIGLFAIQAVFNYARTLILTTVGSRLLAKLRADVFARLLLQPPAFFEERRVGELLSRLGSDVTVVEGAITSDLQYALRESVFLVGGLVVIFVVHTRLSLLMLGVVPPVIAVAFLFGRKLSKISTQERDRLADASAIAEESLSQVRIVQSFVREESVLERYRARLADVVRLARTQARLTGGLNGFVTFAAFSAVVLVLWYGGRLVVEGELTAGALTSFLLYTLLLAGSIGTLGALYGSFKRTLGACRRVFELLDRVPEIADAPDAAPFPRPRGEVAFRGVTFRYPSRPEHDALHAIDLEVRPGEVVALVGRSGAGKSTLVALLTRFYEVSEGAVTIDGHDVRAVRLAELRRAIGLVPQETMLLADTVRENVRFGRPDAADAEIEAAARAARADGFIDKLSKGYDTVVGERGVKLSMGQRQRIAIARCLLKDPAILVLDEATSALDAESEKVVTEALETLMRGRTTFVIAHRLSTVLRADRVVVLDAGRIVETGTHAQLLAARGLYRTLFELQLLEAPADGFTRAPAASEKDGERS